MEYDQVLEQMKKKHAEYVLKQEDGEVRNHTYKDEQELMDYVRHGDVEQVQYLVDHRFPIYAEVVQYSNQKNEEYMAVITIALVARAAIEAGITSLESFALSDVYLQKIATARKTEEILKLRNSAIIAYAELVAARKVQKRTGMYVTECKSYIASHIFKKISVSDVARELALSSVYLERVFKEAEGVSIGKYIQREKIERAKNLLVYSERSILEISDYLCFSSQSHFGKVFREEVGMTPKQYRQANHLAGY